MERDKMRDSFAKSAGVEYVEQDGAYVQTSPGPIGYAPHEYEPTPSGDCDYCGQEQKHLLHVPTDSEPLTNWQRWGDLL